MKMTTRNKDLSDKEDDCDDNDDGDGENNCDIEAMKEMVMMVVFQVSMCGWAVGVIGNNQVNNLSFQ